MTVDLVPEWTIGDVCLTSYPFGVDADSSVDIGEPEMIVEGVDSPLADGDLERVVRHGNRTYVIPFYVMGATLGELSEAEALLRAEMKRAGVTLTHDPGDGFTPASVYEVSTAALTPERDDTHESHLIRRFTLTLTCSPWAMSADEVTVTSLPSGTTTVTVDTCESTSSWAGMRSGAPFAPTDFFEAGSIHVAELDAAVTSPETWTLTRTGSVDLTSTPFLVIETKTISYDRGLRVSASAGGRALAVLESRLMSDGSGYSSVTFDASGVGIVSSLTFSHTSLAGEPWQGMFIREVSRTDVAPSITARQVSRILETVGTERTPASIKVSSPNEATHLGLTIVHTAPLDSTGYSPDLRRWRIQGSGAAPDSDGFSGSYEPLHPTSFEAQVPTSALPPGGYQLVAALRRSVAGAETIHWSTGTVPPGSSTREGLFEGSTVVEFETANIWQLVALGDPLSLPSVRTAAGAVQIGLLRNDHTNSGLPTLELDEAWLFRVDDDCHLSIVDATAPFLWLDSPTPEQPMPTSWMGEDPANRRHPGSRVKAQGNHHLLADGTTLFIATRNVNRPDASATYRPRWHSNAAV